MSRPIRRPRSSEPLTFNLTPLFDLMFTLTIFFLIASHLSSAEQVRMLLPRPAESQAKVAKMPDRVVINCRLAEGTGEEDRVLYSLGPNAPEPLEVISARLAALKEQSPELQAVIRADRRLHYQDVRAAMNVVAQNGIRMLSVVAHVSEDE